MPTIEIICLEQKAPSDFPNLSFALWAENEIISHRGLFSDDLKELKGCIYHMGNPEMRDPNYGGLWAGQLLNWMFDDNYLQFQPEFADEVQMVLEKLINDSPCKKLLFLSDYQFGGRVRRYKRPLTLEKFREKHNLGKLRLNALYQLTA
ncbi:MAG TPA: hypothetical protein VGB45_12525 [Abditibacterium sp.]|jgi:hypothetical protein